MNYHEKKWLQHFGKGKVLMYKRYVYNTFCMFGNGNYAGNFFESLNRDQKNIKCTLEK